MSGAARDTVKSQLRNQHHRTCRAAVSLRGGSRATSACFRKRGGLMPIACHGGEAYTAIVAACPANCFFEFIKNVSGSARMKRLSCYVMRMLPVFSLALVAIAHGENRSEGREQQRFELVETTIADIQRAYRSKLLTPEQLVKMYQARIAAFDGAGPHLNGYMFVRS